MKTLFKGTNTGGDIMREIPIGTLIVPIVSIERPVTWFYTFNGDATWRDRLINCPCPIMIVGYDRLNVGSSGKEGYYYVIGLHNNIVVRTVSMFNVSSLLKAFTLLSK